jgi:hypothetical protein
MKKTTQKLIITTLVKFVCGERDERSAVKICPLDALANGYADVQIYIERQTNKN